MISSMPSRSGGELARYIAAISAPVLLLAALAGYLTHGLMGDLEHTEHEAEGLRTQHHLFHLTARVQEVRGLIYMADHGYADVGEVLADAHADIDDILAQMTDDPGMIQFGLEKDLAGLHEELRDSARQPAGRVADPKFADARFEAYSQVISRLLLAMEVAANRSGLLEGEELDGHYLVDLIVKRLGVFAEIVGRARGITSALLLKDSLSDRDHQALHQVSTSLALGMESVQHNMEVIARVAPNLGAGFEPFRKQLFRRIDLLQQRIESVDVGNPSVHANTLFGEGTQIISVIELLHDQAVIQQEILLRERRSELRGTLITGLLGTGVTAAVILLLLTFYYRTNRRSIEQRAATIHTLDIVSSAQSQFIASDNPQEAFDMLLTGLLDLSGSEYGFIGEVLATDDGAPYLKTHAITNIAWNDETRKFYEENAPNGLEFFNLKTLFGAVLTTGKPVVSNSPASDPRRGGLPEGHPALNAFMGVPIHWGNQLTGMAGVANRKGGYSEELIDELRPYLSTCAHLISAHRSERAIADSEERHRAVLTTMVDAVVVIDDMGTIERFNPAAERMFGYRAEEVIDHNVNILMPEPYHSEHDGYLERYNRTGEAHILGIGREVEGKRKDGSTFPLDLAVSQMEVGGNRMYVGILRDISERKRMERMKGEFISTVSHELRTPLTSIRGALGLLGGGAAGNLPDKAAELLSIAHNNTERLLLLINDILDIDKIESGNMPFRFTETDLAAFIDDAVKAHEGYAEQHNVRFEVTGVDEGLAVNADPDRMMQVLANLLSNAAKFSPAHGVVEISGTKRGGRARISVTDHGPGIPEEFQARVFDKFTQSDATDTRSAGGTGLGLSIARAIVEKHGGDLDFTSTVGEGSTFYVELPVVGARTHTDHAPEPVVSEKSSVLVVEDDADVARIISRMLSSDGIRCDIAPNGEEGLKMLARKRYRVITLDLRLPGMSGVEFLHAIRGKPETRRMPVVVVSANAGTTRKELDGSALEVFDWLEKPIDEHRLMLAVKEAGGNGHTPRVLHVEDEPDVRRVVNMLLEGKADITEAGTLKAARVALADGGFDLVLLDQGLPDGNGADLLKDVQKLPLPPRVVIFSALEVTRETEKQVDTVLRKATTSNARLFDTIKRYL